MWVILAWVAITITISSLTFLAFEKWVCPKLYGDTCPVSKRKHKS